jgi:surface protein
MFRDASAFNGDLSAWNTTNVTSMGSMFYGASSFNGDLSAWNTTNVTDMGYMFYRASSFNGDLSTWNTSNVTNMNSMFEAAESFNQDISAWDTANVTTMRYMFDGAKAFDQDLSGWDVSKVPCTMIPSFVGPNCLSSDSPTTTPPTTTPPTTTVPTPPATAVLEALPEATTPLIPSGQATAGYGIGVSSAGFVAGEEVHLVVMSTPKIIDTGTADANGIATLSGVIPVDLAVGTHTIAVYAPESGAGFRQNITVVAQTLPATGLNMAIAVFGILIIAIGIPLVTRRRTHYNARP